MPGPISRIPPAPPQLLGVAPQEASQSQSHLSGQAPLFGSQALVDASPQIVGYPPLGGVGGGSLPSIFSTPTSSQPGDWMPEPPPRPQTGNYVQGQNHSIESQYPPTQPHGIAPVNGSASTARLTLVGDSSATFPIGNPSGTLPHGRMRGLGDTTVDLNPSSDGNPHEDN